MSNEFSEPVLDDWSGLDILDGIVLRPHYKFTPSKRDWPRANWSHDDFLDNLVDSHGVPPERILPLRNGDILLRETRGASSWYRLRREEGEILDWSPPMFF